MALSDWGSLPNPASGLHWGSRPGDPWTALNPATGRQGILGTYGQVDQLGEQGMWNGQWGFMGDDPRLSVYGYGPEPAKPKDNMGTTMGLLSVIAPALGLGAFGALGAGAGALPAEVGGSAALGMTGGDVLAGGAGLGAGGGMAGGAMDMGVGSQGWMDYLGSQAGAAPGGGGIQQLFQQLQQIPGGSQIAQSLMQQLTGGGGAPGGMPGGGAGGGFNIGDLLPLLGIGSGLNTMFNPPAPAVDPNRVNALWQAGQNTYNTALDPQQALYNRSLQQTQDQSRASSSAHGTAMGPYAAGLENQATNNFNIDWRNNQLGRQVQGTQAFAGAGGVGAQAGLANNAQAFMQNQTGLNNLTTGLGGLFGGTGAPGAGGGGGGAPNQIGSWLSGLFGGGGGQQAGGQSYNPFPTGGGQSNYDSSGTFTPYYTGMDAGGPAYG